MPDGLADRSSTQVAATGATADGNRDVLDLDIANLEEEALWTQFLSRLCSRPSWRGVGHL